MMGSSHVYDMASAVPGALKKVSQVSPCVGMLLATNCISFFFQASGSSHEGIEVTLDPSELDLDAAAMSAR